MSQSVKELELRLHIGENIRRLRVLSRTTQVALAWGLGISQPHLSKVERGLTQFTAMELFSVSKIFKKPMESFFETPAQLVSGE